MTDNTKPPQSSRPWLDGQFLIAMPGMADERFARSVIYMCAHSQDGAMGLIINQPAAEVRFADLLVQLKIVAADHTIRLPRTADAVKVLKGGQVETERGFVLHSSDYFVGNATLPINSDICLTATIDILRAIAAGEGPGQAVLALGYAGWGPGQLEAEMQSNSWLTCPADGRLIFDTDLETKYTRALRAMGVDPAMLSPFAGHA